MRSSGTLEDARARAMLALMFAGLGRFNCVEDLRICDMLLDETGDFGVPMSARHLCGVVCCHWPG